MTNALGFPTYTITGTPSGGSEASITINSNEPDIFGSYWFLDGDVVGWDSPDMRVTMLTKIGNDVDAEGEIPADLHYRGRSLVLKLYCESTSETNRENSRLLMAQAANTSSCLFTADEVVPKYCYVTRSGNTNQGKLAMAEHGYPGKASGTYTAGSDNAWGLPVGDTIYLFETTVELYASDPWKYGVTPVTADFVSGVATFDNPGSYPSMNGSINLNPTGGGTGPIDLETTERLMVIGVPIIPAGAPALNPIPTELTINLYDKLIYDTAVGAFVSNYYYLRDMQTPWLRFPTGDGQTLTLNHDTIGGNLSFQPAWI
jgi:hypothetical protein